MSSSSKRTAKHAAKVALFIEAYLTNGGNGAKAYVEAGWKAKTVVVAAVEAHRLLKKPNVAKVIAERNADRIAKAKVTSDDVLISAARQLRFDPRNLVDEKGDAKALKDWDDETALACEVIEIKGVKVRVNRGTAREQLMKHMGLFEKDNKQKPPTVVHLPGVKSVRFEPLRGRKSGS